ncbi:HSF-type DNA-binding protein [Nitzschia inconspicua]|uniref:HSF-type DNA-binding protein n=1 Tax=Nitzschia inconspicua TaxID=303405 RepID=A0A9K3Q811_9STRA|nr:HSF-type DNA-binding protein [Nitzschia inconspicua]
MKPPPPSVPLSSQQQQISPPLFVPTISTTSTPSITPSTTAGSIAEATGSDRSMRQAKIVAIASMSESNQTKALVTVATPAKPSSSNKDDGTASAVQHDTKTVFATNASMQGSGLLNLSNKMTLTSTNQRPKRNIVKKDIFSPGFSTSSPTMANRTSSRVTPPPKKVSSKVVPPPPELSCPKILATLTLTGKTTSQHASTNYSTSTRSTRTASVTKIHSLKVLSSISLDHRSSFIVRLFAMVHHSHITSPDVCRWIHDGTAVEVHSKHVGLGTLLSYFFQHSKFLSLQRQMNNYGFLNLLTDSPRKKKNGDYTGRCVYAHAYFREESDPEELSDLIRYQGAKSPAGNADTPTPNKKSPPTPNSTNSGRHTKKLRTLNRVPHSKATPSTSSVDSSETRYVNKRKGKDRGISPQRPCKKVSSPKVSLSQTVPVAVSQSSTRKTSKEDVITSNPSIRKRAKKSGVRSSKKSSSESTDQPFKTASPGYNFSRFGPYTSSILETPLKCKSFHALMNLPFPTPIDIKQHRTCTETQSVSSPENMEMLSNLLLTPPSQQFFGGGMFSTNTPSFTRPPSSKSSPDGVRVLFHAAQAVEYSPIKILPKGQLESPSTTTTTTTTATTTTTTVPVGANMAPHNTPDITISSKMASAEPSPIMSMVNMDLSSFRQAMDALHESMEIDRA